ncbi:MAG: hypothetical protein LBV62_03745 [Rickettsiales bacterium]|jgi:hypothetical protein|nr:hypothetical protein [Rickettsiales bacterium]
MIGEWFNKNISQPVKKFYHKYILRETDWSDDVQSTANDEYNVIQESSESLGTYIQSNENDVI